FQIHSNQDNVSSMPLRISFTFASAKSMRADSQPKLFPIVDPSSGTSISPQSKIILEAERWHEIRYEKTIRNRIPAVDCFCGRRANKRCYRFQRRSAYRRDRGAADQEKRS